MTSGDWAWCDEHYQFCKIIGAETLWGKTFCRIWLPSTDTVVRIQANRLKPIGESGNGTGSRIAYTIAAARIADALTQDVLLAPIESSVIPLPHQIRALSRAISNDKIRYLLADEVGLGKTIEAGLIMRELKLRGLAKRILVVAPKGLVTQWVSEMRVHFNEEFQLILPDDLKTLRRISLGSTSDTHNPWRAFSQVICPLDSVKPMDGRRGWSREQVADYNRERFEDLIAAGWDMVVVDEAHRLAGSTDQVARYRLGQGLGEAAPYLLLLSATPHQGKTDAFHRLVSLLDPTAFPDIGSMTRERVHPYVIRTEKRRAIDAKGEPLFKPRQTRLVPVSWEGRQRRQQLLYEAVTEYVREGYNQAVKEKRNYVGFLMILMQRLVTSSTRAIRTTLERRLDALHLPEEQLSFLPVFEEEWADLDGQEQLETILKTKIKAVKNEQTQVKMLLDAARYAEATGSDAKAEALLEWIYRLQKEETDPDLKFLIFTEFVPTQEMLRDFLTARGFSVVCLNGSMGMDERKRVQDAFAGGTRILISTDAGGEGLNLQFCHVVINYDIPWNPMRLEQRIGRVDRIGQTHTVRAINLVLEDTVEYRVREVLEEKLAIILSEFGVDKAGDVLDSAEAEMIFDDLYVEAILNPESLPDKVESMVNQIREQTQGTREGISILGAERELDPADAQRLINHPIPYWIERMTIAYLESHGGKVEKNGDSWNLTWPTGETIKDAVFTVRDTEAVPSARQLTLEDPQIRGLAMRLPRTAPGQPIPCISLSGLSEGIQGIWSLWDISITRYDSDVLNKQHEPRCRRIFPLFLHNDGRLLLPTARHIWDTLMSNSVEPHDFLKGEEASDTFEGIWKIAEMQGRQLYEELLRMHRDRLNLEREKGENAFASRRRALERIGLPAVRSHRLGQLIKEEQTWRERLDRSAEVTPEMLPLLILRVGGCNG